MFPKNYKTAKSLTLVTKAATIPAKIVECQEVEHITISNCQLKELPVELLQLPKLRSITFYYATVAHFGDWIRELQLEKLMLLYVNCRTFPPYVFELPYLRELTCAIGQMERFPIELTSMSSLEHIEFEGNYITAIPSEIGKMKQLKTLNLRRNYIEQAIPLSILEIPALRILDVRDNPVQRVPLGLIFKPSYNHTEVIPSSVFKRYLHDIHRISPITSDSFLARHAPYLEIDRKHKQLRLLDLEGAKKLVINNELLTMYRVMQAANLSEEMARDLFVVLLQKPKAEELIRTTLYALLALPHPTIQRCVLEQLSKTSPTFEEMGLGKDSLICIKGKTVQKKGELKVLLKEQGAKVQVRSNAQTTHLLVGGKAVLTTVDCTDEMIFFNETQLQTYLNEQATPYLLEEKTLEVGELDRVHDLLCHTLSENVAIGLGMLEGMGIPIVLLPLVYGVFKTDQDAENRALAGKLLRLYGTAKVKEALKSRKDLYIVDHKSVVSPVEQIQFHAALTGFDSIGLFDFIFYKYHNEDCLVELLTHYKEDEYQQERLVQHAYSSGNVQVSVPYWLSYFPKAMYQLHFIEGLSIDRAWKTTELPDGISQLQQLSTLRIESCDQLTQLPNDLFLLPALKVLKIDDMEQLKVLPQEVLEAAPLRELSLISMEVMTELPPQIGRFSQLEMLTINYSSMEQLPPEIGQLKNLKRFYALCANIESIPDEIGNLKQLEKLDLLNTHELVALPETIVYCPIKYLRLGGNYKMKEFPKIIYQLPLIELHFEGANWEWKHLPEGISQLQQLQVLNLTSAEFRTLPEDLCQLSQLHTLVLDACVELEELPSQLEQLTQLKSIYVKELDSAIVKELEQLFPTARFMKMGYDKEEKGETFV